MFKHLNWLLFSQRTLVFNCLFESASIAKFCNDMAISIVLDDFDSFEDIGIINSHNGNLFHAEKILSNFVIDCLEINNLDGDLRLIRNIFAWIEIGLPEKTYPVAPLPSRSFLLTTNSLKMYILFFIIEKSLNRPILSFLIFPTTLKKIQ